MIRKGELEIISNLYSMSEGIDYSKYPLERVNMNLKDSLSSSIDFFSMISDGNNEVINSIKRYIGLIKEVPWVDGGIFTKGSKISRVLVPNLDNVYASSILIHELTHALDFDGPCDYDCPVEHDEVLPFLNQFLYIDYLKNKYDVTTLQESNINYMIHNQLLYNVNKYVSHLKEKVINIKKVNEHLKYVIGSLYAIVLYEWYKKNGDFMHIYKEIYRDNESLDALLNYYNVTLDDMNNVKLVKRLIKD